MDLKLASVEKRFAGIETYFAEFETVGLLLLGVIRPPPLVQGPTQTILHGTVLQCYTLLKARTIKGTIKVALF